MPSLSYGLPTSGYSEILLILTVSTDAATAPDRVPFKNP